MSDPLAPPPVPRNPDTAFLFGLCLLAGTTQILARSEPGSVDALVPDWMALSWGAILIVGAVLVLTGVFWPRPGVGALIELVGRAMFGPTALAYAVAIFTTADVIAGTLAAAPFVGFSVSCLWRAWQIVQQAQRGLRWAEARGR